MSRRCRPTPAPWQDHELHLRVYLQTQALLAGRRGGKFELNQAAALRPTEEPPMPSLVTRLAPKGPTTESYTEWLTRMSRWQRRAIQTLVVGSLLLLAGLLAAGCSKAERVMYQLEGPWACILASGLPVQAAELSVTHDGKWGLITTEGRVMRGWGPITCQELAPGEPAGPYDLGTSQLRHLMPEPGGAN